MKIGLVGWGVETRSAYEYFGGSHAYVIGSEEPRDDFPTSSNVIIHALTEKRAPGLVGNASDLSYLDHYDDCDLIIYQGAAHKNLEKKFAPDHAFWSKAKTTLHIFFEETPTKNIIGITGTKGKGTTSTLVAKMLEAAGEKVFLAGNIGVPILDVLGTLSSDDWVVLELSSFQLYKFPYSPHIAVHLMMMPEHIDEWHKTMEDYVEAKRNIFAHQTAEDIAVYMPSNPFSNANAAFSMGKRIPYGSEPGAQVKGSDVVIGDQKIVSLSDIKLLGAHNLENICAALTAVWQVTQDTAAIKEVLSDFSGLEHRLQLAAEIDRVKYYDDSFGTTPDTAIVAMNAFSEPKVIIVGGHDKGNPFDGLAKRLAGADIRHVIFIGTTAQKICNLAKESELAEEKVTIRPDGNSWTMPEIVAEAAKHAHPGDIVLLSTGCASFGLFKDYKDRGNQFHKAVSNLNAS